MIQLDSIGPATEKDMTESSGFSHTRTPSTRGRDNRFLQNGLMIDRIDGITLVTRSMAVPETPVETRKTKKC